MNPEIFVKNAGLVILNGYLNYFFEQCGLLDENRNLPAQKAQRAALLLQYVFNPGALLINEEDLVLNKVMCGIPIESQISTDFEASQLEQETTGQMLQAIISHWEMIKNSSPEGFRESWLQREGKLTSQPRGWELLVEQRAFDILLDYKPFSISPVRFTWMPNPINVIWR